MKRQERQSPHTFLRQNTGVFELDRVLRDRKRPIKGVKKGFRASETGDTPFLRQKQTKRWQNTKNFRLFQ
jgi:hypothetical protein